MKTDKTTESIQVSSSSERIGDWCLSYSGKRFYPLDLRPEEIDIRDIAHSLSNICRFGGHCKEFYSVAQHSVIVCDLVEDWIDWQLSDDSVPGVYELSLPLIALLHDAPEAYCGDVVRPLKLNLPGFDKIEHNIWATIAKKFNLSSGIPKEIGVEDARALLWEKRDLLTHSEHEWQYPQCAYPDLSIPDTIITPVSPKAAEKLFLDKFEDLYGS